MTGYFIFFAFAVGASDSQADAIVVSDAVVKLTRQVKLPAAESGVLQEFLVKEGDIVEKDQLLARSDDRLASIDKRSADLEYRIATEQSENDIDERYAEDARCCRVRVAIIVRGGRSCSWQHFKH